MNQLQELELCDSPETWERFKVTDLNGVNWCLRKLAAIATKREEIEALASAEIRRIEYWQDKQLEGISQQEAFFNGLLEEYHRAKLAEDPKAKTISTPYGKLQLRKQQPEWKYCDDVLLEWLRLNRPDLVKEKIQYIPDKSTLKKQVTVVDTGAVDPETGEVIPGISVLERTEAFSVEVEV